MLEALAGSDYNSPAAVFRPVAKSSEYHVVMNLNEWTVTSQVAFSILHRLLYKYLLRVPGGSFTPQGRRFNERAHSQTA